jgi:hypothetical protein
MTDMRLSIDTDYLPTINWSYSGSRMGSRLNYDNGSKPLTEQGTRAIIKEVFEELQVNNDIKCEYCKTYNPIKFFRCDWCNAPLERPKEFIKKLEYNYSENVSNSEDISKEQFKFYSPEEYEREKIKPTFYIPEVYFSGT